MTGPPPLPIYDLTLEALRALAIDYGTVSVPPPPGAAVLQDDSRNWSVNAHTGRLVKIIRGPGAGQLRVILGNSDRLLTLNQPWIVQPNQTSAYVILGLDVAQILRNVFGGGSDISAANPLETHDPKVEDVEDKLDHPTYGLAALKAAINSLAGGAFYGSYGPKNVEVDNDVDFGIILYDPSGNIITTGEITPGTYTVHRVRGAVDTEIVAATASSEAAGRVYMTYNFPVANWAVGDIFYITFSGITVTLDGVATEYPDLYIWGRVVRELDISGKVDAVEVKLDDGATGLAALATLLTALGVDVGAVEGKLDDGTHGLAAIKTVVDAILVDTSTALEGKLDALALICTAARGLLLDRLALLAAGGAGELTVARVAYLDNINQAGLLQVTAARAALLDQITAARLAELDPANIPADLDTIKGYLDTEIAAILAAVDTEVAAIKAVTDNLPNSGALTTLTAYVDELETRLSAVRAGYLDNLNNAQLLNIPNLSTLSAARIGYLDNINQAGLLQVTAARAALLDQITAARMAELDAANIPADTDPKVMGRLQIIEVSINSAANAGDVLVATVTTQPCLIESVVIHADAAQTANMTSCGIFGGAGKVVTFISAADAVQANLNAADKQVAWTGAVRLAATKTIVISLVGTGATAVDLTITIAYRACTSGGYLA